MGPPRGPFACAWASACREECQEHLVLLAEQAEEAARLVRPVGAQISLAHDDARDRDILDLRFRHRDRGAVLVDIDVLDLRLLGVERLQRGGLAGARRDGP